MDAEFERVVFERMFDILVHPVKIDFDRTAAFDEAMATVPDVINELREQSSATAARPDVATAVSHDVPERHAWAAWLATGAVERQAEGVVCSPAGDRSAKSQESPASMK